MVFLCASAFTLSSQMLPSAVSAATRRAAAEATNPTLLVVGLGLTLLPLVFWFSRTSRPPDLRTRPAEGEPPRDDDQESSLRIDEAEWLMRLAVDQERRVIELKQELNHRAQVQGDPIPYPALAAIGEDIE
ncbi:MAG: hypothetical protein WBG92_25610, partial [Thiohalocapsa sp.]